MWGNRKQILVAVCVLASGWLVMSVHAEEKQSKKQSQAVSSAVQPDAKQSVIATKQKFFPALNSFELKFQEKLTEKMDIDFAEKPLAEVIQHFQKFSGASFVVLKDELDEQGLTLDDPVSMRMPDISFKSALVLVLKPLGLSYAVEQDFITISTEYDLEETLRTRVYPVGDYCQTPADYVALEQAIKNATVANWRPRKNSHGSESSSSKGGGTGYFKVPSKGGSGGGLGGGLGGAGGGYFGQLGYEEGMGGTISIVPLSQSLVISQTFQAHEAITELLTQLRQARAE